MLKNNKIFIVGDSTVCDYGAQPDNYYLQRFGYGTQLFNYLNLASPKQVVNLALSGRSSLSFLTERNYDVLKNSIGKGDYLIIGFGHNDEKSEDKQRFTDPEADFLTDRTDKAPSFAYTLYTHYVKLAKDRGATPVLCTPIVRYCDDGVYEGKCVHVTEDGDYPSAIRKLARDTHTAVVDLTAITKKYYSAHGENAKFLHAFTTYSGQQPDGMDKSHLNGYGAKLVAHLLLNNLPADCPLKTYVNGAPAPGQEDFEKAINRAYVKPDYDGFDPSKHVALASDSGAQWYKTAMCKNAQFSYANGAFTITADGAFESAGDTFGAVFVQIDESKNFTAQVKAKIINAPDKEGAFGLMYRDDIYIDKCKEAVVSNFVSASVTGTGKANVSRIGKLCFNGALECRRGEEYTLSVVRTGQIVYVRVTQDGREVKAEFTDVQFVGVDNTKTYLCMFANGGMSVEFHSLSFKITGEAQGA